MESMQKGGHGREWLTSALEMLKNKLDIDLL
jgi:hypothetical protein